MYDSDKSQNYTHCIHVWMLHYNFSLARKRAVLPGFHIHVHVHVCMSLLLFSWTIHVLLPNLNTFHMPDDPTIQLGTCEGRLQQQSYNHPSTKLIASIAKLSSWMRIWDFTVDTGKKGTCVMQQEVSSHLCVGETRCTLCYEPCRNK